MQVKWLAPCNTTGSTLLLILSFDFIRARSGRKWSTVVIFGQDLPSTHSPVLTELKSISETLLEKFYFPHSKLFLTGRMWPISHCSISPNLERAWTNCNFWFHHIWLSSYIYILRETDKDRQRWINRIYIYSEKKRKRKRDQLSKLSIHLMNSEVKL